METKSCSKCNAEKPLTDFHKRITKAVNGSTDKCLTTIPKGSTPKQVEMARILNKDLDIV